MTASAYHTALSPEVSDAEPRDFWAMKGSTAFVHDLWEGLPPEFSDVDVIYAEIPWADGFDEFCRRAGAVAPPSYSEWLYRLSGTLSNCGKPWIMVGGYAMSRRIGCQWLKPVRLNGSQAIAMGAFAPSIPEEIKDAEDIVRWLSGNPNYRIIGDPCCGYGRAARIFAEAGKHFVATDINPVCIGHIAAEAPEWLSNIT